LSTLGGAEGKGPVVALRHKEGRFFGKQTDSSNPEG
jgi:hypothetical protein